MLRKIYVTAFVDWNSQFGNAGVLNEKRAHRRAELTSNYVAAALSRALSATNVGDRYDVSMRAYHGWYSGLSASENRKGLGQAVNDRLVPTRIDRCTFDWGDAFGATKVDGLDRRLNFKLRIHLPDTLRTDFGVRREKMVDTAMACDILTSARSSPASWRVVMAEDDDIVPSVLVAERWSAGKNGRTILLRRRVDCGHLAIGDLIWPLEE